MANPKIVLAELDIDIKALLAAALQSKEALAKLKTELLALKDAGDTTSARFRSMQADMQQLTAIMDEQLKVLKQQVKKNEDLAESQQQVAKSAKKAANAQEDLAEAYQEAAGQIEGLSEAAQDAAGVVSGLNAEVEKNNTLMAQEGAAKQVQTFTDYKNKVIEAAQSLNIFNGGFGGFISRAQEAGGVGPMVKGAFEGIASGIGGMTKSALSFIATPFGLVISAIAVALNAVVSYFQDTEEGMDALTAVTRPLQSVFNALMDVFHNVGKVLSTIFTDPVQAIKDFGGFLVDNVVNRFMGLLELMPSLGKAVALLFKGQFSEAGKIAADAVGKVALGTENITGKVTGAAKETGAFLQAAWQKGQQIDTLQKSLDKSLADYIKKNSELGIALEKQNSIADDTNLTFAEREKASLKAIDIAKEQNKLVLDRMDSEQKLLELKLSENGFTSEEKAQLAEMAAKRAAAVAQYAASEKGLNDKLGSIRQERANSEKVIRQKSLDDAGIHQRHLLDLFVAENKERAKTLKEQVGYEQEYAKKSVAILDQELKQKKISREEYKTGVANINRQTETNIHEASVAFKKAELDLWMQEHKSKIEAGQTLTKALADEEEKRLQEVKIQQEAMLAEEKGTTEAIIRDKRARGEALTIQEVEFQTGLLRIREDYNEKSKANAEAYEDSDEAQKLKRKADDAAKVEADYQAGLQKSQEDFDAKIAVEEDRYTATKIMLEGQLKDKLISQEDYDKAITDSEKLKGENIQKLEEARHNAKMQMANQTFTQMAEIFGKESKAGKAFSAASALIDTYQAANVALSSSPPPFNYIAAAAVTATGLRNVSKITSSKDPKFEQGGLVQVGGNRHAAGGTFFTGSDGTRFEAEQGELIGVMNRNAAHHFMAFNNAFPAGGSTAPNYFANGGIVSREIAQQQLNVDELAAKIALANSAIPAPIVAVQDIITQGNSYVRVREDANF